MQEQSCPQCCQPLPGKRIPSGLEKIWRNPAQQTDAQSQYPPQQEEPLWLTLQRQREPGRQSQSPHPPVAHVWLAGLYPLTANSQRKEVTASVTASGHESGEGDRATTSGHGDLPDEQGIANAPAETSSDQKIAAGHIESDPNEIGSNPRTETPSESERDVTDSGQKTAIGHAATARWRTVTETSPGDDALDCWTASGKQSESEIAETGHGSCPTERGLHDPSLFLDPKIGKHERIANGSGPLKTLPTHHVAERAVMSGERPPRKQRGQGVSAANEQPPLPNSRRRQATRDTSTPLAGPKSSGRRGSLTGRNTRCFPRLLPLSLPS